VGAQGADLLAAPQVTIGLDVTGGADVEFDVAGPGFATAGLAFTRCEGP
jgi:hypothetical protein